MKLISILAFLFLLMGAASAETNVTCGDVLSEASELYTMNASCTMSEDNGFNITANGITFDCNGFSITGDNSSYGVYVASADGVTIQNCVISNFSEGIYDLMGTEPTIQNCNVSSTANNGHAIHMWGGDNGLVNNCNGTSIDGIGIYVYLSDNVVVNNSFATSTYERALYLGGVGGGDLGNHTVANCILENKGSLHPALDIASSWNNTIINNTLIAPTSNLLQLSGSSATNVICWNNFTNTSEYYVTDANGTNLYNGTVCNGEGNLWFNVLNHDVHVYGTTNATYGSGLFVGENGAVPYGDANSDGKTSGLSSDEAPLTDETALQCGNLSVAGTTYTLSEDVSIAGTSCFNVTAQNVALDCAGFSVMGSNASSTYGIYSNQLNTTIRNCNISNFEVGIYLNNSANSSILSTNVSGDKVSAGAPTYSSSVMFSGGGILIANSNIYSSSSIGLYASGAILNLIIANTTSNASSTAIYVGGTNILITNSTGIARAGSGYGIRLSGTSGGTVLNSQAIGANAYAMLMQSSANNNLIANTTFTSTGSGIGLGTSGTANNNTFINISVSASGSGFYIDGGQNNSIDCAGRSMVGGNQSSSYGVYSNQTNTTVKNCNISNFATGIYFNGADNGTIDNVTAYTTKTGDTGVNGEGIYINNGANFNTIANSNFTSVNGRGIFIYQASNNNQIINSTGNSTSDIGITATISYNNTITNSAGISTSGYGIRLLSEVGDKIINTTAYSAATHAIWITGTSNNNILNLTTDFSTNRSAVYIDGGANTSIDCSGASIIGSNATTTYGVYSSQFNTTVKNCNISNFSSGVYFLSANNSLIQDTNASTSFAAGNGIFVQANSVQMINVAGSSSSNGFGIYNSIGIGNRIINSSGTSVSSYGMLIDYGSLNNITNSKGISTSGRGFTVFGSSSNKIINSNGTSGSSYGLYVGGVASGNQISNTTANSGTGYAFYITTTSNNNVITNLTANQTGATALAGCYIDSLSSNNTIQNSICQSLNGQGLLENNATGNIFKNNYFTSAASNGAYILNSTNNVIQNNTGYSNMSALRIENSTGNNVTNNTLTSYVSHGIYNLKSHAGIFSGNIGNATSTATGTGLLVETSENNTFTTETYTSASDSGIELLSSSRYNNFTNTLGISIGGQGIKLSSNSNGNKFTETSGNSISKEGVLISASNNNSMLRSMDMNNSNRLVAYWKFDEGSGTSATDSRGGNTGTLTSGPVWVSGKSGQALQFDGVDAHVSYGPSATFNLPTTRTVLAWVKIDSTGENTILDKGSQYWMRISSSNTVRYSYWGATSGAWRTYTSTTSISPGVWQHVAVVEDHSWPMPKIYLNGTEVTISGNSTREANSGANDLYVGGYYGSSYNFNGTIDEVMIFNRALSAGEIRLLYENPSAKIPTAYSNSTFPALNITDSNDNTFTQTNVTNTVGSGVYLKNATNSSFTASTFFSNLTAAFLTGGSTGNTFSQNILNSTTRNGFTLENASSNTIYNNTIFAGSYSSVTTNATNGSTVYTPLNAGFEEGIINWTGSGGITDIRTTAHSGVNSSRILQTGNAPTLLYQNLTSLNLTNGQNYTASAWLYMNSSSPQFANITGMLSMGNGTSTTLKRYAYGLVQLHGTADAWTKVNLTFTYTNATDLYFCLYANGSNASGDGFVYWDDAAIENITVSAGNTTITIVNATAINITSASSSNVFYHNNITAAVGVSNNGTGNQFNTSVATNAKGNYWQVVNGTGIWLLPVGGLVTNNGDEWADLGSKYPTNATNAPSGYWVGFGADYGAYTNYTNTAPSCTLINYSTYNPMQVQRIWAYANCSDAEGDAMTCNYIWYRNGVIDIYATKNMTQLPAGSGNFSAIMNYTYDALFQSWQAMKNWTTANMNAAGNAFDNGFDISASANTSGALMYFNASSDYDDRTSAQVEAKLH